MTTSKPLHQQSCEACRADAPRVSNSEYSALLAELPGWTVFEVEGIDQLQKTYTFKNFLDALAFTQAAGQLAEAHDHHPALLTEWGRVTVSWWTHKIKGLHKNDFVMAAKTDQL